MNSTNFTGNVEILKDMYENIIAANRAHTIIVACVQLATFFYVLLLIHIFACKRDNTTSPIAIKKFVTKENEIIVVEDNFNIYRITKFPGECKYVFEVEEKVKKMRCEQCEEVDVEVSIEMTPMNGQGSPQVSTATTARLHEIPEAED